MPIYCWAETGEYVEDSSNSTGLKRVIISDKLDGNDWMLLSLPQKTYKYKIGEKFLFPLVTTVTKCGYSLMKEESIEKVVGIISYRFVDEDDGCCYYNIRFPKKLEPITVGECFLERYARVVPQ